MYAELSNSLSDFNCGSFTLPVLYLMSYTFPIVSTQIAADSRACQPMVYDPYHYRHGMQGNRYVSYVDIYWVMYLTIQ